MNLNSKLSHIKKNKPHAVKPLENWLNTFFNYILLEGSRYEFRVPNIKRGQILYVDFGYNVLSEFRYAHYCVAINNSPQQNSKVTVIPITSKSHPYQLAIGTELADKLDDIILNKERSNFWRPFRHIAAELGCRGIKQPAPSIGSYETVYPNCSAYINHVKTLLPSNDKDLQDYLDSILKSLVEFDKFLKSSPSLLKPSYLKTEDITTISKARIIRPLYSSHPLYQLRLSDETLDKLDAEIKRMFTKT